MNFTLDELDAFRHETDPIADHLIKKLSDELDPKSTWKLYSNLINDLGEVNYENMHPTLKDYFKENQHAPSWIDDKKIKIAEQLFLDVGPLYSVCLLCRALPIGYSSFKIVKVLTTTGYLSTNVKEGTAKRLLETSQFLFNVMDVGTFKKDSKGIKHILKVRFLHAMIRFHLLKHNWDIKSYDIPINQEDMIVTILTFSVGAIQGLDKINISLSPEEKDAMVHYWAVVGLIIGVDEKLLPSNYKEGEKLYEVILAHQAKLSSDGIELTKALCDFIRGFLPIKFLHYFPEYLIAYLIDNQKYSNLIGLKSPKSIKDKAFFNSILFYFKFINKHSKGSFFGKIKQKSNVLFATKITDYFAKEFDLKLTIPKNIQKAWGLKKVSE